MQIIAVNAVGDDFGFITDPIHLKQKFLHKRGRRLLYVVRVEVTKPANSLLGSPGYVGK